MPEINEKESMILTWKAGTTPVESKLLWYWNGVTGEYVDYEHPESNRPSGPSAPAK